MTDKNSSNKKRTRKAVLIGSLIGAFLMPIIFFIISLGTDWTGEKVAWLCINSLCTGVLFGGGIGYLLVNNHVSFH